MKLKRPHVLYFIPSYAPTQEQAEEAMLIGAKFRNASLVDPPRLDDKGDPVLPEHADFVMGEEIPEAYAHIPKWGEEDPEEIEEPTSGEQVGAFYLHMIARGKWLVLSEEGEQLNPEPLNKADARTLALENTEED